DILAEREFDPLRRVLDDHLAARLTVAELDDGVLAADRIRRAMQEPRSGSASRQGAINRRIIAGYDILDAHLWNDREAPLFDAARNGAVRMCVDDPGHRHQSCGLDHLDPRWCFDIRTNGLDLAMIDQDRSLPDRALGDGQDRGVLDQNVAACMNRGL